MARDDAFKQCDICRYQYNTNRLLFHDVLRSRVARMFFTILLLLVLMFVLGFIADPIINLYIDPYETMSSQRWLEPVTVSNLGEENEDGWWIQHFMKGFVSIGIAGFLKTVLLSNPWNFWNFRHSGLMGGTTRTSATGRDRAVNISWIALLIGVGSALYLLYDQVRKFAEHTLHKVAVRVIELQMDDDDDDLIPPAGVGVNASQDTATGSDTVSGNSASEEAWKVLSGRENVSHGLLSSPISGDLSDELQVSNPQASPPGSQKPPAPAPPVDDGLTGYSSDVDRSKLDDARAQTWSFKNIEGNGNP